MENIKLNQSLELVLADSSCQIPACYIHKAKQLHRSILDKRSFSSLKGVRLKRYPHLVRFKLGREYRLIYHLTDDGLMPLKIITRQSFNRDLRRRR